ncbi:MAG TPA: peptidase domain-containing ABC transporter [Stellaceae bacterium]|nr:peptidase domain-containing ABC transporter [Stellaceae bacterium]
MVAVEHSQALEPRTDAAAGVSLLGSLVIVARHHGVQLSVPQLVHDHLLEPGQPSVAQLLAIAEACGLRASRLQLSWHRLLRLDGVLPAVVLLRNGQAMVLRDVSEGPEHPRVTLQDPNVHEDEPLVLDEARFAAAWTGEVLLFKRDYRLRDEDQPFGMALIAAQFLRDRRIARDIGISAFMLSLLAVSPILFWRFLIDSVLYSDALQTLTVLSLVMLVLIVAETLFGYLRRYLVLHVSRRVDAKLSVYMFDRVIQLPVDFFERTPVGEITRDMQEMHKIRSFFTGSLLGTMLDSLVLVVFLPIMFFYSPLLTFFVLGFAALICGWIILQLPKLRQKSKAVLEIEGEKGSFLVETLHGVRTVKALGLDERRRHEWDVKVARAAHLRFDEGRASNGVQTAVTPLERVMTTGVFALAVYLAIATREPTYVGALYAFMMLSQRVAAPLVQLSTMLTQFDEAMLAVSTVGALVNRPPEEGHGKGGIRTPIVGRVEFSGVRFRYAGTTTTALDGVSFDIPEGSVFGLMGRSGSGKTTVTRLLQLFHGNYEGLIKVDGTDLRQYDVDHLRSSFGVVMQENFLFSGTIRETIASGKPDASFDEVVMAARLAGAEEFIERLPRGYDTYIYEGSPNLSGGQRQRLAIARALITNPRILILDEATSALDAESEAIVNANLARIAEGRTMIVVSHRLSSLVNADAILVLERGRVYDIGTHSELVERCDIYSNLWHQQHQHLVPRPSHEVIAFQPAGRA